LLLDGAIELGLTEGPLESEELESTVFFQDELVAIAPAGHPLLETRRVSVRESSAASRSSCARKAPARGRWWSGPCAGKG
jgi:DNA-binding transcriptional LysR family regulator